MCPKSVLPSAASRMACAVLPVLLAVTSCADSGTDPDHARGDAEVSGIVSLERRFGVPGAVVRLVGAGPEVQATSDASGRFVLRDVPVGTWQVRVEPPGGLAVRAIGANGTVTLASADHVQLDIELSPTAQAGSLVVEVVRDSTAPYSGAKISVLRQPPGGDTLSVDTIARAITAANGTAMFSLPDGVYIVGLEPPPALYVVNGTPRYNVAVLEGSVTWVGFSLSSSAVEPPTFGSPRAIGRVFLNELVPVTGVNVTLSKTPDVIRSTSDGGGVLSYEGLSPGAWTIDIDVPAGYTLADGQTNPAQHYVTTADTIVTFDVYLADAARHGVIEVSVVADSAFLDGVAVRVRRPDTNAIVAQGSTDAQGRYRPAIAPGTYAVEISVPPGFEVVQGGAARAENVVVRSGRLRLVGFFLVPS